MKPTSLPGWILAAICALTAPASLPAQTRPATAAHRAGASSSAPTTIPALLLSDIHLDPYADPAKVARLNAAPIAQWSAIFSAPASATQQQDFAALQRACPVFGVDTSDTLWQSSLSAIHAHAANIRFATLSGDLLGHYFDCKYKTLLPAASHADYLDFVEKTVRYIVGGLRAALPGVPVYLAMGNNDTACGDYQLDPEHDEFLGRVAPIVAEAAGVSDADRASVLQDFTAGGYYSVPLAGLPHARLIVLDDIYLSAKYTACNGASDLAPGKAQLAWLEDQLAAARQRKEHVWVMGHIPPGVNLVATALKMTNVCASGQPQMFLGSERLADILGSSSDTVRLVLFGHTHNDEMRLLGDRSSANPGGPAGPGVPAKIVAAILPINGNPSTFTVAKVDPETATLDDYTVFQASNLTGVAATWPVEYTYSTTYRQPAFNAAAVSALIAEFQKDPSAAASASHAYLHNFFPGAPVLAFMLQAVWPQYVCSMDHDSGAGFAACACSAGK